MPEHRHFIPAAGHDLLLPLYDPLQSLLGANRIRQLMLDRAAVQPGQCILDIGCGTGNLVVKLLEQCPEAVVTGLDPDPKALARARRKADRAGVFPELDQGFSDALPYDDQSIDRVFSSFMFHHLEPEEQQATLTEVHRILKPEGSLHLIDFTRRSEQSNLQKRMREASFANPEEVLQRSTLFGRVSYYCAAAA